MVYRYGYQGYSIARDLYRECGFFKNRRYS
nr:MAG TPA: Integrin alpha cytoplasmic region [Caudoviricetes sp.]